VGLRWRRDDESVTVSPALLYTTVRDSLVFACALPLAELVEWGRKDGWIPILTQLP